MSKSSTRWRHDGGYIAYDPQEDTETSWTGAALSLNNRYIAYDPQEDTETANALPGPSWQSGVTSPTIRKRILKRRARMAISPAAARYIAYDPQEDTETLR